MGNPEETTVTVTIDNPLSSEERALLTKFATWLGTTKADPPEQEGEDLSRQVDALVNQFEENIQDEL